MGSHMYTVAVASWLTGPRAPRTSDRGLRHARGLQTLARRPLPARVSPACVYQVLLSAWHGRMPFAKATVLSHPRSLCPNSALAANACLAGGHACLAAPAPCAHTGRTAKRSCEGSQAFYAEALGDVIARNRHDIVSNFILLYYEDAELGAAARWCWGENLGELNPVPRPRRNSRSVPY